MPSDGKIIIDATIDYKDYDVALNRIEQSAKRAAGNADKSVKDIGKALDDVSGAAANTAKKVSNIVIEPTTRGIDKAQKELEKLVKEHEALSKAAEEAKENMDFFSAGGRYDNSFTQHMISDFKDAADAADEVAQKIWDMEDAIAGAQATMSDGASQDEYQNGTKKVDKSSREAAEGVGILESALGLLVIKGINTAISRMDDIVDSTEAFRREMSMLETNAAKANVDISSLSDVMRDLYVVTQDTDSNLEAVSNLLRTGVKEEGLSEALDYISGAVLAFPDTIKIDNLSKSIQETVSTGKAVGQFGDLLGRTFKSTGVSVETFNKRMENTRSESLRLGFVMQVLRRTGLNEYKDEWMDTNTELVEASKAQYDITVQTARLGAALQPAKTVVDEMTGALAGMAASLLEKIGPGWTTAIYGAVKTAAVLATVVAGIKILKTALGGASSLFGKTAKGAADVASGAGEAAKGLSSAGSAAKGANMHFLSVAGGIAIIAAGFAVAVLAIAELVKAFSASDKDAVDMAAAIGIVTLAVTAMLGAMVLLSNTAGHDSTRFLLYAASILIIAGAFSIMTLAVASLVRAMSGSDTDVMQLAKAIAVILGTMTIAIGLITLFGLVATKAMPGLIALTIVILALAAAMLAFAEAVKAVKMPSGALPPGYTMPRGYAGGTASAQKGWKMVGERGPELAYFRGGEHVYTASQSMARQGALASGSTTYRYITQNFNINADNVRSFARIVDMAESEGTQIRKGVAE